MSDHLLILLKDQFQRAFAAAKVTAPKGVFEALCDRYREPHRAYHTLQHINECLGHLKTVRNAPPAVAIALWFHDAIYDPQRQDNEERSAAWAREILGKTPLADQVEKMILATKHGAITIDVYERLVADIDLAILAAGEPRYSEYEAQIRREYAYLDDAAYRAERFKLLRSFSDRVYIYGSAEFRALETRARKNLERSINALIVGKK
ncbi:putative metal-dependent HD superfamily phosphohydrolase [Rhizomicrobium palustre]|uniref:Putative metal-dependent HD superfamily phosphohydrolase n=1 Tax=Rhizomicrobium palustre TaxID=189966 RepID=A0A846MZV4_9PROT|nr:N-methyl-D-aspartate receptor NMDAR2C subunit [Rhizomicrobium palustre]NIK88542.1 putative metal-dependent HD superfamily phosphohydrolase [Rhizomicrobium palustre]